MPKKGKNTVPLTDDIIKAAREIEAAQNQCRLRVVTAIGKLAETCPDANIDDISAASGGELERSIDGIAELAGWCYARLGSPKTLKAIRKALGYSYP